MGRFRFSTSLLFIVLFPLWVFTQEAERLPSSINTDQYDEIAPVLSADGSQLFFSRLGYPEMNPTLIAGEIDLSTTLNKRQWKNRLRLIYSQLAGQNIDYPLKSIYNQDIWVAHLEDHQIQVVEHPPYPLNSALPNGVLAYWDTENEMILLNQFFADGSMNDGLSRFALSQKDVLPRPLYIYDFYTFSNDVQATISAEGDVLILALQREDALGDQDLYISYRSGLEIWSAPIHLGKSLNTAFRESTPFLSKDKRRLFFASNRPGGLGGMDIYVSERVGDSWTDWKEPKLLGSPINSASNDSQPCFSADGAYLYFSSTRMGSSDIFRFPLQLQESVESKECWIKVFIRDGTSYTLVPAQLSYSLGQADSVRYRLNAQTGTAFFKIQDTRSITLFAEADAYPLIEEKYYPEKWKDGDTIFIDLLLREEEKQAFTSPSTTHPPKETTFKVPTYKKELLRADEQLSESFILEKIRFEAQSSKLKETSYAVLNELILRLKEDSLKTIIIEGHTDNGIQRRSETAEERANRIQSLLQLSKERAAAVAEYMIQKGIPGNRIRSEGMGAAHPLNDNSNDMEREMNRRVEIIICKQG
jgi:outer membrane protein OmpA-like peptidoglycan-associated protein